MTTESRLTHQLQRSPSAWKDVGSHALMLLVALLLTALMAYAYVDKATQPLPAWYPWGLGALALASAGLLIDVLRRLGPAMRGTEPEVQVGTQPWRSGLRDQLLVRHPDVTKLQSLEVRLVAEAAVAEERRLHSPRGARLSTEIQHETVVFTVPRDMLPRNAAFERTTEVHVPEAAAGSGWRWLIVVRCDLGNGHHIDCRYPVAIADAGEARVIVRDPQG